MARPQQNANRRKRSRKDMEYDGSTTSNSYSNPSGSSNQFSNHATQVNTDIARISNDKIQHDEVEDDDDDEPEEEEEGQDVKRNPRSQCLPIGMLPADFDGTPVDGSQYLAMVDRDNRDLPSYKSVTNPYSQIALSSSASQITNPSSSAVRADANGESSKQKHPALPKDSWESVFPTHFQGYRKHVQEQISTSEQLSYPAHYPPIPLAGRRPDWYAFVNGYLPPSNSNTKGKAKAKAKAKAKHVLTEEEMMNASIPQQIEGEGEEEDMELDEESEEEVEEKIIVGKTSNGNQKRIGPVREPLFSILQRLNSPQAIRVLSHFAHWISESINQLPPPYPSSPELLPTQPDYSPSSPVKPKEPTRVHCPISSNYFNWIFSLLLIVDQQLSSNEISILRELARAAMRVAGHRWIMGVVAKDISENWILGDQWKNDIETNTNTTNEVEIEVDQIGPKIPLAEGKDKSKKDIGDNGVDQILARSWMIVHAVSAGWVQKDLLIELETLFT
ncbi:uncharacterized protein IL334_002416 [Kwoniella shivajii]|uniref:Uncharacterized protein n=1 Tax=Kwoniella shivajii TaxID=564305 RepID=A0ABZ1CVB7_9TREE|nr:hypothetical protein IL334_002416 [Kwoniella shivajii]